MILLFSVENFPQLEAESWCVDGSSVSDDQLQLRGRRHLHVRHTRYSSNCELPTLWFLGVEQLVFSLRMRMILLHSNQLLMRLAFPSTSVFIFSAITCRNPVNGTYVMPSAFSPNGEYLSDFHTFTFFGRFFRGWFKIYQPWRTNCNLCDLKCPGI